MRFVKGLLGRCVDVVEAMAAVSGTWRLSELAAALDLPKSATYRLLAELQGLGWVEQLGADGPYRLTLRFALLGHRVLGASGLPGAVQPVLQAVAEQSRELVRLTVLDGDRLTWLAAAQGAPAGLLYQPRMDDPVWLHATANGKVFLASLEDATALRLAESGGLGTVRPTARTLATAEALLADLRGVRTRRHAVARGEAEPGVTAVAVAVEGSAGLLGTISVAGPAVRIDGREAEFAALLHNTAQTLCTLWPGLPVRPEATA